MSVLKKYVPVLILVAAVIGNPSLHAENVASVTTGVDFVNRYVWRGLEIGNSPNLQPTCSFGYTGFEIGAWAAYSWASEDSDNDEIDFWISYSRSLNNGVSISAVITDYYYPNAGIDFFNFNNYDDEDGPGAHLLEAGLSIKGPESFPVTLAGYINVYNEEGNNIYFQIDYPVSVGETALNFFIGGTPGSKDNPDYYGTEDFAIINTGVSANRNIVINEKFSVPLSISYILNPDAEISYVVVGVSL
jgi:uncharacterized protein (TIGR02001 family)